MTWRSSVRSPVIGFNTFGEQGATILVITDELISQ